MKLQVEVTLSDEGLKQRFIQNKPLETTRVLNVDLTELTEKERELFFGSLDISALKKGYVSDVNKRSERGGYVLGKFNSFDLKAIIAEIKEAEDAYQKIKTEEENLRKEIEIFRKHLETFKDVKITLEVSNSYVLIFRKEVENGSFTERVIFNDSLDKLKKRLPEIKAEVLTKIERRAQNEAQIAENREVIKLWGQSYGSELLKKSIKHGYAWESLGQKEFKDTLYPVFCVVYEPRKKDTPALEELEKLEDVLKNHPNAFIAENNKICYKHLFEYPIGGITYRKELYVYA
jgi:hypothetical protein